MASVWKTRSGQSTEERYKCLWQVWDHLEFIAPVMQPSKSQDSFAPTSAQTSSNAADIDTTGALEGTVFSTRKSFKKS